MVKLRYLQLFPPKIVMSLGSHSHDTTDPVSLKVPSPFLPVHVLFVVMEKEMVSPAWKDPLHVSQVTGDQIIRISVEKELLSIVP